MQVARKKLPSRKYLIECFLYSPETGEFYWRHRPRSHFNSSGAHVCFNKKWAGKKAFTLTNAYGHNVTKINMVPYYAHRVAWKIMTGKDPTKDPDHEDGNPENNRWNNLREATFSENGANKKMYCNNKSGRKGVSYSKTVCKWVVYINQEGKRLYLGNFDCKAAAVMARENAEKKYHKEFARAS